MLHDGHLVRSTDETLRSEGVIAVCTARVAAPDTLAHLVTLRRSVVIEDRALEREITSVVDVSHDYFHLQEVHKLTS